MRVVCKDQYYDGDATLFESDSQKEIVNWLENVLMATNHFSLMSELNSVQANCHDKSGKTVFPNKYEIPIKIINLVIQKFRLTITIK